MNKSIIKRIAKKSNLSWHPMTKKLHKSFMESYSDDFYSTIIKMFQKKLQLNQQTIYLISNREQVKLLNQPKNSKEKANIDYQIVAGCFNPWFDDEVLRTNKQLVAIELSPAEGQSRKAFKDELQILILLDFLKSLSQANMSALGNNFFALKDVVVSSEELERVYLKLMGHKISAKQFTEYFGRQRDFVYKHKR
ncbi:hypothetical protein [Psychrobacter sp. UBA2769]|uniref:hypothetical protein n=1 Tax=Psychrobacter sp. UBA2769 TaxID=1947348 RepID=UPI0025EE3109|nr:hypothetical protein [Psychrobacter sp. UBA2769]